MTPDWRVIAPHRPVGPRSAMYVSPPSADAQRIADWILAGGSTVLVGGPTGVGKSSTLGHAAELLHDTRLACLVPIDRWENLYGITPERVLLRIAGRVAYLAMKEWGLSLNHELAEALQQEGVLSSSVVTQQTGATYSSTAEHLLRLVLNEVTRLSKQGAVALFIDGLEKLDNRPTNAEIFAALGRLPPEIDLVVVTPWNVSFGPSSSEVVRPGERFLSIRAAAVQGETDDGRVFLVEMLMRRLGIVDSDEIPHQFIDVVHAAAALSGGIPRMFLQLVADSAVHARIAGRDWPAREHLDTATAELQQSLQRVLLPGDSNKLRDVDGTPGIEMELTSKIRLMAHGLLLEGQSTPTTVHVHPLIRSLVGV